jgi:hypothetical protein
MMVKMGLPKPTICRDRRAPQRTAHHLGTLSQNQLQTHGKRIADDLGQRSTPVGRLPDDTWLPGFNAKKVESSADMIIISPRNMREAMAELRAMYFATHFSFIK